jgi:lysophospholipase
MELVTLAKNPVPSGAKVGMFRGYDGTSSGLHAGMRRACPAGTVCLLGGRTEFIEKYFEVIADLRRRGFAVATMDWRGQGGSQRMLANPRKGHVRGFWEYERDLTRFMKDIVLPDCPPPFIGLATPWAAPCSAGGYDARLWLERIVLGPMIAIRDGILPMCPQCPLYAEVGCALDCPRHVVGGSDELDSYRQFEGNALTSDHERWLRTKSILDVAPSLGLGSPTIGWLKAAMRCCRRLSNPNYPARINVPLLLFAAANDTVVSARAVEDFAVKAKVASCILMPGARHEILQENDGVRTRFWAAFDAYLGVDAKVA